MILATAIILSLIMAIVIWVDVTTYKIPNWLNGVLLGLYPVWYFLAPVDLDIISSLIMFGVLFATGFALFAIRVIGGGDVKLLAICGLYTGWNETGVALLFYMGVIGGALSFLLIMGRWIAPVISNCLHRKTLPKILTMGAPIPYGLAIAGAFLILIWMDKLPGLVIG